MAGQVFCNASVRRTWPGNASAVSNRPAEQFFALTIVSPPQLHLQRQTMLLFSRCSVFSTAVNIPKRQPVKSFSRGMYGSALRSKRFQAVLFAAKQKRNSRASTEEPAPAGDVFTGIQPFSLCETLRLDGGQNPAELRGINRSTPQVGKISKPHPQRKIIQQRA